MPANPKRKAFQMDREKLAQRIADSVIPKEDTEMLLKRLKVASNEGCAAVVRDFEDLMARERRKLLQSHRRVYSGRCSPQDKRMILTSFK